MEHTRETPIARQSVNHPLSFSFPPSPGRPHCVSRVFQLPPWLDRSIAAAVRAALEGGVGPKRSDSGSPGQVETGGR